MKNSKMRLKPSKRFFNSRRMELAKNLKNVVTATYFAVKRRFLVKQKPIH
jgi:hypothetical protein